MKKIITSVIGTILGLSCAMGQSTTINVPAKSLWVDSNIYVTNGESVTINVNGNWCYAGAVDGIDDTIFGIGNVPDGFYDGPGDSDIFLANDIHNSAIAYIGSDPYVSTMGSFPQASGYWEVVAAVNSSAIPMATYGWVCKMMPIATTPGTTTVPSTPRFFWATVPPTAIGPVSGQP